MKILAAALALLCIAATWQTAEPGWQYDFPRDHHRHENFKTEWWYFTGNLTDAAGHRFGYELTFFRQGIRPPNERGNTSSRFVVDDLKFAHFTISDAQSKKFLFFQKVSRGSFGEAGFDRGDEIAWIDSWKLRMSGDGSFHLAADAEGARLNLQLVRVKAPVIHGKDGVSQKAAIAGHASHYYSISRLRTEGELVVSGRRFDVHGESWFDHEWATNQLAPGQAGWNWVSAQFDDGSELMLYEMRLMTPLEFWKSPATEANYPIGWRIEAPKVQLDLTVHPVLKNQELVFTPLIYWEGAFDLVGTRAGKAISGRGYLELTGYAAPLLELNR
jgi:predicted secreted hydrolase